MEKKYVLHPGHVRSRNDWDSHFIDAIELAELYKVPLIECMVIDEHDSATYRGYPKRIDLPHLYPRRDGNYANQATVAMQYPGMS